MKILITGAGGFIGRHLTQLLASGGHDIIAVDNNIRGSLESLEALPNIKRAQADVLDAARMDELCAGVDAVYHLAYINGTKYFYSIPDRILEIGIIGTHNILKSTLKHGIKKFYLASSSEAYQDAGVIPTPENVELKVPDVLNPRYSYGGGKIACELLTVNYLRNKDTQFVIFRPHNVYGPQMGYEHVLPELIRKVHEAQVGGAKKEIQIPILGSGEETRAFIYATDAAQAIKVCTLDNAKSGIYHIGNNEEISILQLLKTMGEVMNLGIRAIPSKAAMGATPRRCPDNGKIRALGYSQQVSLSQGLTKTIEWYLNDYSQNKNRKEIL